MAVEDKRSTACQRDRRIETSDYGSWPAYGRRCTQEIARVKTWVELCVSCGVTPRRPVWCPYDEGNPHKTQLRGDDGPEPRARESGEGFARGLLLFRQPDRRPSRRDRGASRCRKPHTAARPGMLVADGARNGRLQATVGRPFGVFGRTRIAHGPRQTRRYRTAADRGPSGPRLLVAGRSKQLSTGGGTHLLLSLSEKGGRN